MKRLLLAVVALTISVITLAGWVLDMPRLADFDGDGVAMLFNTALCGAATSIGLIALVLRLRDRTIVGSSLLTGIIISGAIVASGLGVLTLMEHIADKSLNIDLVIRDWGQAGTTSAGRMGPPASLAFTLLGVALLALSVRGSRIVAQRLAAVLGAMVVSLATLSLMGWLFGAQPLHLIPKYTAIASQTAVVLILLGFGVMMCVPSVEPMRTLLARTAAASMLRRSLTMLVIVCVGTGLLISLGRKHILFTPEFGSAIRTVAEILLLSGLLWWGARVIGQHEQELAHRRDEVIRQAAMIAAIVQSSDDAMVSKNLKGTILSWNKGAETIFGHKAAEAIGRHISLIIPDSRRSEEDEVLAKLRRGQKIDHFETQRITKDGRLVDVSLTISPVLDAQGRVVGASKVARDITLQKAAREQMQHELETKIAERTAALERAQAGLRRAERLAAMGTMAAGIGHDLSNIMLPIRWRLEALGKHELPASAKADVSDICESLTYLDRLASGLLQLAANPDAPPPVGGTDIREWWAEVHGMIRSAVPKNVRLVSQIPHVLDRTISGTSDDGRSGELPPLPRAHIHRVGLTQAVFNLVQNAGEAMSARPSGVITIGISPCEIGGTAAVALTVADNGPGMTPEVAARCFEPYFSTRDRAVSTGMGLSLVRGVVDTAGGTIELKTAPGEGAAFTLKLPAARAKDEGLIPSVRIRASKPEQVLDGPAPA